MRSSWESFYADDESYRVDLTPLIDTLLVLLIFFMLISTFITTTSLDIKLPEAKSTTDEQKEEKNVVISVNENGEIFIEDKLMEHSEIPAWINTLSEKTTLEFKVDKKAPFQSFIRIIDCAKERGLNSFKIQAIKENDD